MSQRSHFSIEYSEHSDDTAEYEDQLTDLTDLNITSFMTDMTEVTPLPDDIDVSQISQYFDSVNKRNRNKTCSNAPQTIEYLIGSEHESICNSVFDDLTYDNMNPFIVLLGSEGIGKTTITTFICNDLLHETEQLFKDGILYLDLMKYEYKTFEECLIAGIKECGLDSVWIEKHDDFLEINASNVFSKMDQYLSNSLIVFEDFDRFMDANNLSLEDCNQFLFNLFENISLQTKIIITSRKKLPVYYNFNAFRTKFYEISSFNREDTLNYLLTYCPSLHKDDIVPYLDDIADLTSYKPLYIHSLYKLWQNIRMFESTFDSILTLYQEIDHEQHLRSHNPFNERKKEKKRKAIKPTISQSSSSSTPSSHHEIAPDTPPNTVSTHHAQTKEEIQPLFAYTNLYCAPNSPSIAEFHSPLSTYNGHYGQNYSYNNDHLQSLELPQTTKQTKQTKKQTRPRSQTHGNNKKKRNKSVGFNLFDPSRRASDQKIQQFYKINTIHQHRYSVDTELENVQQIVLSSDNDDRKDDHFRVAPLSPLSPWNRLNPTMLSADDTVFKYGNNEREKKRKKKKSNKIVANHTTTDSLLSADNLKAHLDLMNIDDDDEVNTLSMITDIASTKSETYDGFLAALGAEIHKQQKEEKDEDAKSNKSNKSTKSMQNYNIRINDIDINKNKKKSRRIRSLSFRFSSSIPPSGYLAAFDLPPTPPLSSVVGLMSDGSAEYHMNEMDDTISVNSDTLRQNKLISITLMNKEEEKEDDNNNNNNGLKVGDVYFNKFLRMTLILNIGIHSWSRTWLINGLARSLRTADIRFSVHKDEGIADKYSYVSLLCRCDEYDIKQLKYIFEFSFISHELEKCIAESLGQPTLKIICASCVSYRHFKYLYPKEFLNWMTNSLPNANIIKDYDDYDDNKMIKRKKYKAGLNKTSIMTADYIKLPFAMKQIAPNHDNNNNQSPPLTPQDMTILHFMSL